MGERKSLHVPGHGPMMATWYADFEIGAGQDRRIGALCVVHRRTGWTLKGPITEEAAAELVRAIEGLDWDFEEQADCPAATMAGLLDALGVPA